ncbi:Uncharacterised protein [Mycobacteroides abscessus subsp. bolletii]|nr:DUF4326 domain-containing protein [Mycobacteroides abscessus]SKV05652.1 Uncharacterised protein [Mycobacteroides abscessus subsp. bolletii]
MAADTPCKWCDCPLSRCDAARPNRKCCPDCRHPKRIQLRRLKGWRKPEGAVVVSRPGKWGNPYTLDLYRADYPEADAHELRYMATSDFEGLVTGRWDRFDDVDVPSYPRAEIARLRGHDLACWCPPDQPCHADVLLELANG